MPKEYEYEFLDFDKSKIISKIKELKGSYKGTYLFKIQYLLNDIEKTHIRVRDEGFQITMTVKTETSDFDEEEEIIIDNFDNGVNLLLGLGCKKSIYIEKIREIYTILDTEIIFDTPIGYPDILEIESKTLKKLKEMVKHFNLKVIPKNEQKNMYVELFGINLSNIKNINNLTFKDAKKKIILHVTKNKKEFNLLINKQIKAYKIIKNTM